MQKLGPDAIVSRVTSQTMDLPMPVAVVGALPIVSLILAKRSQKRDSLSPTSTQGKSLLSCSGLKTWSLDVAKIAARASEWSLNQPCAAHTSARMGTKAQPEQLGKADSEGLFASRYQGQQHCCGPERS